MISVIPQMKALTKWNVSMFIPVNGTTTMVRYNSFCIMSLVQNMDHARKYYLGQCLVCI